MINISRWFLACKYSFFFNMFLLSSWYPVPCITRVVMIIMFFQSLCKILSLIQEQIAYYCQMSLYNAITFHHSLYALLISLYPVQL